MDFIPYGRQQINDEDIEAVVGVLKSDFLTQGPVNKKFESAISKYCGSKYSVAVNSATSALHIACLALGVEPGDLVWTTPITFVATANAALYCGAGVDFVDIDRSTGNMSMESLELKLKESVEKNLPTPKVVIPVHLGGQSCDMFYLSKLAHEYSFKIIEDASHSIGSKTEFETVGSCRFSDICVFSFHPVKIITTGEGGMATTNSKEYFDRMKLYSSHGINKSNGSMLQEVDGAWYYEQQDLGYNYRMTELQAALGCSQLERVDQLVAKRNELASFYREALKGLPLDILEIKQGNYSSYHLFIIQLQLENINLSHKEVFAEMRKQQIGVNLHYIPVYRHPYYRNKLGFIGKCLPEAERYYERSISIPLYPDLQIQQTERVVKTLKNLLEK